MITKLKRFWKRKDIRSQKYKLTLGISFVFFFAFNTLLLGNILFKNTPKGFLTSEDFFLLLVLVNILPLFSFLMFLTLLFTEGGLVKNHLVRQKKERTRILNKFRPRKP